MNDYPQQISISTLHLVISQEINDTLANTDFEGPDADQNASMGLFHEEKVTIGKPDPNTAKALANVGSEVSARSRGSTGSANGERTSQDKSTVIAGAGALPTGARNVNASEIDDYKSKILSNRLSNEPSLPDGEIHANFLDDCFGENTDVATYLDEATQIMRREENRIAHKSKGSKMKSLAAKRVDYKEQVLSCLQYKGL